jgi:uncharacterized protein YkwD
MSCSLFAMQPMLARPGALAAAAGVVLIGSLPAQAAGPDTLSGLVNAYRAAPGACAGQPSQPAPPLAVQPELGRVRLAPGILLQHSLERAGYKSERAEAIAVTGPPDAVAAMAAIQQKYCRLLLSNEFSDIGTTRSGDEWLVVFAQPYRPPVLPAWPDAGQAILELVNAARAAPRSCGDQPFAAAPPVTWSGLLADAALAHSEDMARNRYFRHEGSDGSHAGERARRARYDWRGIGENIASGQASPEEAVAGWLSSPGHCANLMNPRFTQMGAAYAINRASETGTVYWTQVFAAPR